jgi:hypothetical protein
MTYYPCNLTIVLTLKIKSNQILFIMRKYFLLLSSCLTLTLGAQNELILDKSDDNVVRPVQLVNLSKDANGNYTAIIMTQLAAYTLNTTGILIHGAETHYVNELRTLSFNNSGAFTGATGVFLLKRRVDQ